jgi:hypothetical protein
MRLRIANRPIQDDVLFSRNRPFIEKDVQEKIAQQVVFAAGVGVTSTIASVLCRTGFSRFILADGDRVDLSNLNRQAYMRADVQKNKASAMAELLRAIRPDVTIEVLSRFLDEDSYLLPLSRADVVINSIDFDKPTLFLLNRSAQTLGKVALIPLNLGWGSAVLVFTPQSPSLEDFLGIDPAKYDPKKVATRIVTRIFEQSQIGLPSYMAPVLERFVAGGPSWEYDPQLGAAVYLTAALTTRIMVALVAGDPVRAVPEVIHVDLYPSVETTS